MGPYTTNEEKIIIAKNHIANRPTLDFAKTFIPEVIHAKLRRKVEQDGGDLSKIGGDFPGIFDL